MANDTQEKRLYCHRRYHLIWMTKYRYKFLEGTLRLRVKEIIGQVAHDMNIKIINETLTHDYIHLIVLVSPYVAVSGFVIKVKNRCLRKIKQEFHNIRKIYGNCEPWSPGYFSSTNETISDEIINVYI